MFLLAIFLNFSNMISNKVLNTVSNLVLNTVLNTVLNLVLNTVLNMVLNTFWTWVQVEVVVVFRLNKTLALVSILLVFSRLVLHFILRSSFIRVNVSNSNKISEYFSSEMELSDNAFEMRLLIVLRLKQLTSQSFHVFLFSTSF